MTLCFGKHYKKHGKPLSQAERIIFLFGGVQVLYKTLRLCGYTRDRSSLYRWTYPKKKGGTAGLIPTQAWPMILKAAQLSGILLNPADLSPTHSHIDLPHGDRAVRDRYIRSLNKNKRRKLEKNAAVAHYATETMHDRLRNIKALTHRDYTRAKTNYDRIDHNLAKEIKKVYSKKPTYKTKEYWEAELEIASLALDQASQLYRKAKRDWDEFYAKQRYIKKHEKI